MDVGGFCETLRKRGCDCGRFDWVMRVETVGTGRVTFHWEYSVC